MVVECECDVEEYCYGELVGCEWEILCGGVVVGGGEEGVEYCDKKK